MARTGRIIHTIAHAVFFALSTVTSAFGLVSFIDIVASYAQKGTAESGELFGIGLGIAILTVFLLFGAIATALFSGIDIVLSVFMIKRSVGGRRVWGIVSLIINVVYVLSSSGFLAYALVMAE